MDWEGHDVGSFVTKIENSDFSVWDTTVESGFRVRLVLTVSVASSRAATHFDFFSSVSST